MQHLDPVHRLPSVKTLTGLSRSTIYRLIADGKFPKPIKLGERASGWRQSELEVWLESRPTSNGGGCQMKPILRSSMQAELKWQHQNFIDIERGFGSTREVPNHD